MAGFTKTDSIWMNGKLVPWDDAHVHVTAHALQYGTGVFEGMRSYDTPEGAAIFRLDAHMRRFADSARAYELDIPYSFEDLCTASLDVIRANGLENAYLRPLAFFDSHSFSVWPKDCPVTVAIIAVPGRQYIQGGPDHGVRVTVSTVRRIDASTLPPFVKACGHYTNSVRAVQEAFRRGFDEAILLNTKGDVAEGSGANLFLVKNGTVITNEIDASIVLGITRDSVLTIARDLGLPVVVRPMSLADVQTADEVFFSGTAVEVTPIKDVDGHVYGDGTPGPITRRIQKTFFDAVHGRLPQYHQWLSFVGQTEPAYASSGPPQNTLGINAAVGT
jgi:branched-chain amino acid aminotransferase